jgi:hypothetical protein
MNIPSSWRRTIAPGTVIRRPAPRYLRPLAPKYGPPSPPIEVTINGRTHVYEPDTCRCGWRPTEHVGSWNQHVADIIATLNPEGDE